MKRIIVLLLGILCTAAVSAQTYITEKFDGASGLQWYEYSSKKSYAQPQDGRFELKSKNILSPAYTSVTLPINTSLDFTLRSTVVLPVLSKKPAFGLFFDEAENGNTILLLFSSQKFGLVQLADFDKENPSHGVALSAMFYSFSSEKLARKNGMAIVYAKLKECKNARLNLEIKYHDGKYSISINDVPYSWVTTNRMLTPSFGFCTLGAMQIESFSVEQDNGY